MGGNLSLGKNQASHIDLAKIPRQQIVSELKLLLSTINTEISNESGTPLWTPEMLKSGKFLSGSSLHFFDTAINDELFKSKKPTVGDVDTMVPKEMEQTLSDYLSQRQNDSIGNSVFHGFQRGNEQFSGLFELKKFGINVQIDFEFVEFQNGDPTDWSKFSHSSSWADIQNGVKGVFHKWLIQSMTALTSKSFYLRKMTGRGKAKVEQDIPTTDSMFSFAVSSKEGGGLRAKYVPELDATGQQVFIDGKPVMRAAPAEGYSRSLETIFKSILGKRIESFDSIKNKVWSFTELLNTLAQLLSSEEKLEVTKKFLEKTFGPGAQEMYRDNPEKDISEKSTAVRMLLREFGLESMGEEVKQMITAYRAKYKVSESQLSESFARKGIKHLFHPGSTVEIAPIDFVNWCTTIVAQKNKPVFRVNLKVDGAGIRLGKDSSGNAFFMTSRMTTPKYLENVGDFEAYAVSNEQSEDRVIFAKKYDTAMQQLLSSDVVKSIPADTIVQVEMMLNSLAQDTEDGMVFVNIPYAKDKLGKSMTLVPFSVKKFSTGEIAEDEEAVLKAMVSNSDSDIKVISNRLSTIKIPPTAAIADIAAHASEYTQVLKSRNAEEKQALLQKLAFVRQALSQFIYSMPIEGKGALGDIIEGLVVESPDGVLVKITSDFMKSKVAAKQLAAKSASVPKRTKTAVVTFGSFIGHIGHEQLINMTLDIANKYAAETFVFVSPVVGVDDPVPVATKIATLRAIFPSLAANIQTWPKEGSPLKKIEKELVLNTDFKKIIVVVGEDRYASTKAMLDHLEKRMKDPAAIAKFGGTQNEVEFLTVNTPRSSDQGGTGISFTMLREILKSDKSKEEKFAFWRKAFSHSVSDAQVEAIMQQSAIGMGLASLLEAVQKHSTQLTESFKQRVGEKLKEFSKKISQLR